MKTVTIEFNDRGGFEIKGLEDLQSRSEFIKVMLAARFLETRALEKGYLPELSEGLEGESKAKVRLLTKKEQEELEISNPVPPTYIQIELPKNVPSRVKPIVIFPSVDYKDLMINVTQCGSDFNITTFKSTFKDNEPHVVNLNTGVE